MSSSYVVDEGATSNFAWKFLNFETTSSTFQYSNTHVSLTSIWYTLVEMLTMQNNMEACNDAVDSF